MAKTNPYQKQITARLKVLRKERGMRYWNEVARAARMEPAVLYNKVRGVTPYSLEDIWILEKALGGNILWVVDTIHHSDATDPEPWI